MKWFYHDWVIEQLLDSEDLDVAACEVMERYLADRLCGTQAGRWVRFYGLDDPLAFMDDFNWVLRSMRASAFKRIQAPPAIRIASSASICSAPEMQGDIEPSPRFRALESRIRAL